MVTYDVAPPQTWGQVAQALLGFAWDMVLVLLAGSVLASAWVWSHHRRGVDR